jgi:hypothetical protein
MHTEINEIPIEMQVDGIETRGTTWGDVLVRHIDLPAGVDFTPLFKGLPDDRCQCPHWGYVFKGSMTVRVGGRDEVYNAGEAFYTPPGHTPLKHQADTEVVMFSPEKELRKTGAAVRRNAEAEAMHVRTSEPEA